MAQGLSLAAVLGQPRRRAAMERSPLAAPLGTQLGAQQLAHQRVVGEPAAGAADRGHHRVAPHQVRQPCCAIAAFGEHVGQVAGEGIHDRRPQQEGPQIGRLAVEQLFEEVVGDRLVGRRESGDVRLGLRVVAQGERRQPQRRGPAFGATAEHGELVRVERRARMLEQLSGLVLGEGQMALTDLAQPVRQAQAREAQRRVLARDEDEPERGGCLREQAIDVGDHLAAVDLVKVVEDEDDGRLAVRSAWHSASSVADRSPRLGTATPSRRRRDGARSGAVRVALPSEAHATGPAPRPSRPRTRP